MNRHIDAALKSNFSLAAACERHKAARAVFWRDSSDLYPDLDLLASARGALEEGDKWSGQFALGLLSSYEIDVWGRVRAYVTAEGLRAAATEEDYRTAALSLSGDIATTWVSLAEAYKQQELLDSQIETNLKVLEVIKARFGAGQARGEDVLRQKLLIEANRDERIGVESEMETLLNQLSLLRGEAPQACRPSFNAALPDLPPLPYTGLPSELVSRRPDIRAALLEIEAADQDLAASVRDQYPRLTLSASYISEAAKAGLLFSNWIGTLAGGLIAPLIDAGERRAEVYRSESYRNELVNIYAQKVLEAFREVENALIREEKQAARLENLELRLKLAQDTFRQLRLGYSNGADDFLSVLIAQFQLQEIERNLLRAKRDRILFRIALYRALAGGFETPRENYDCTDQGS